MMNPEEQQQQQLAPDAPVTEVAAAGMLGMHPDQHMQQQGMADMQHGMPGTQPMGGESYMQDMQQQPGDQQQQIYQQQPGEQQQIYQQQPGDGQPGDQQQQIYQQQPGDQQQIYQQQPGEQDQIYQQQQIQQDQMYQNQTAEDAPMGYGTTPPIAVAAMAHNAQMGQVQHAHRVVVLNSDQHQVAHPVHVTTAQMVGGAGLGDSYDGQPMMATAQPVQAGAMDAQYAQTTQYPANPLPPDYRAFLNRTAPTRHSWKQPWSNKENAMLKQLVDQHGPKSWALIAKDMESRSGKQCRERWLNHLDPRVRKDRWTTQEDDIIFSEQNRIGNKWTAIAKQLPGRTANSIKNRFYSAMRRIEHRRRPMESTPDFASTFFPGQFKRPFGTSPAQWENQGPQKKRFKSDGGIVATSTLPAMANTGQAAGQVALAGQHATSGYSVGPDGTAVEPTQYLMAEGVVIKPQSGRHERTVIILHGEGSSAAKAALEWVPALRTRIGALMATTRLVFPDAPGRPTAMSAQDLAQQTAAGQGQQAWHGYLPTHNNGGQNGGSTVWHVSKEDLREMRGQLHNLFAREISLVGGDPENIFIGGVLQGCCVALDAAITYEWTIGGAMGIWGHIYPITVGSISESPSIKHLPLLMLHGTVLSATESGSRYDFGFALEGCARLAREGFKDLFVCMDPALGTRDGAGLEFEICCQKLAVWIARRQTTAAQAALPVEQ